MAIEERYSADNECPECLFSFEVSGVATMEEAKSMLKVIAELHGEMAHGDKDLFSLEVDVFDRPSSWAERPSTRVH